MYNLTEQDYSRPLREIEHKLALELEDSPFAEGSPYYHGWDVGLAGPYISWLGLDFANQAYLDDDIIESWKDGNLFKSAPYKDIDSYMNAAREKLQADYNPTGFDESDIEADAVENCAVQYAYDHFKTFMALEAIKALEKKYGPDAQLPEEAIKAALEVSEHVDANTRAEPFKKAVVEAAAHAA